MTRSPQIQETSFSFPGVQMTHTFETAKKKIAELRSEAETLEKALPALRALDRLTTRNGVKLRGRSEEKTQQGTGRKLSRAHKAALAAGRDRYFREKRKEQREAEKTTEG